MRVVTQAKMLRILSLSLSSFLSYSLREILQISILILNEIKRIDNFYFPWKQSENQRFSNQFRGNKR